MFTERLTDIFSQSSVLNCKCYKRKTFPLLARSCLITFYFSSTQESRGTESLVFAFIPLLLCGEIFNVETVSQKIGSFSMNSISCY